MDYFDKAHDGDEDEPAKATEESPVHQCPRCGHENSHVMLRPHRQVRRTDTGVQSITTTIPVICCDICNSETPLVAEEELIGRIDELFDLQQKLKESRARLCKITKKAAVASIVLALAGGNMVGCSLIGFLTDHDAFRLFQMLTGLYLAFLAGMMVVKNIEVLVKTIER